MSSRRMRFTLKTLLAAILCVAIVVHLAVSAWRVYSLKPHMHTAIVVDNGMPATFTGFNRPPFWSAYWLTVLGISLNNKRLCDRHPIWLAEKCELETPEIRKPLGPYVIAPDLTRDQIDLYIDLMKKFGRDARYENGRITIYNRPPESIPASGP